MSASASLMSAGELPLDIPVDEALVSRFPIHRACRDGDVGALLSLSEQLSSLAALTAEDPYYGWTPLHWAAYFGQVLTEHPRFCVFLFEKKKLWQPNYSSATALYLSLLFILLLHSNKMAVNTSDSF